MVGCLRALVCKLCWRAAGGVGCRICKLIFTFSGITVLKHTGQHLINIVMYPVSQHHFTAAVVEWESGTHVKMSHLTKSNREST